MTDISKEEKVKILDLYIKRPISIDHPAILRSIKADVKAVKEKKKKATSPLYNTCMGVYRKFMKDQGLVLNLEGRKATLYRNAMESLIKWMQNLAANHGGNTNDEAIKQLFVKLFASWHLLSDFHQGMKGLPEIYKYIEEIISQIKNGTNKKNSSTVSQEYKEAVLRDLQ